MCVKWYLTVVQRSFIENGHRKFLYCFPMASTMNANRSVVVRSYVVDRKFRKHGLKAQRLGMVKVLF